MLLTLMLMSTTVSAATATAAEAGLPGVPPPVAPRRRFEAEDGSLSGSTTKVASVIKGFSGTGYVTGFSSQGCSVAIAFTVPAPGVYELVLGFHSGYGAKGFGFRVNGGPASTGTFAGTGARWGRVSAGLFSLPGGRSTAEVLDGWGFYEVGPARNPGLTGIEITRQAEY